MIQRSVLRGWAVPLAALALLFCLAGVAFAQVKNIPPKPDRYIIDQAGVIDAGALDSINSELEQFERDTSNQIVVAIYPSLPADAELYQYCTYVAQAWGVGQKGKDNGIVLFVFINDRKLYIAVGTGLQGAVTDALSKNIQTQVINPHFKQADYAGGIQAGVEALIAASKGEYKGTGSTDDDSHGQGFPVWVIILIIIIFIIIKINSRGGGGFGPVIFSSGGFGGGGGYSGGGGGGGGFSGGGGSFSGGGSGGSW
jgi:uncharacterized protein